MFRDGNNRILGPGHVFWLVVSGLVLPSTLWAQAATGTVDLLPTPPELTTSVAPNVVVTQDDSGSMGRHFMPDQRPFDNGGWGVRDDQNNVHNNRYDYANIPWTCAAVIDPRVTDPSNPRSFPMNGVYYNPNITYQPPLYADGVTEFPVPSFTNAWNNGVLRNRPVSPIANNTIVSPNNQNDRGNRNLSTARFCTGNTANNGAGYYRYRATAPALVTNAQGRITNTATLYNAANWEWVALPAAEQTNFAIWWSYYHTRALASASAISRAFASFDENVRVAWQNLNSEELDNDMLMFKFKDEAVNNNVRQRFYNWLFRVPVAGGTPLLTATDRAGQFYMRGNGGTFDGATDGNPYWDRDLNRELSCRQNFHFNVSDGFWNQTRPALASVSPRDHTNLTLPDGREFNVSDLESRIIYNQNAGDNNVVTLADIAWKYWATNLREDFENNVSTRNKVPPFLPDRSTNLFGQPLVSGVNALDNKEVYWNPANDPASWSHMVNFMIGFGVNGLLPRNDANLLGLRNGTIPWPQTENNNLRGVDDMWHAAINSRGRFFTAADPNELIVALQEIVASILARRAGSTATSVSLPLITDGTVGFTAGFDTSDWSGYLTRDRLDSVTGQSIGIDWDAGCILTGGPCATMGGVNVSAPIGPDSRNILTSDGRPGTGKAFRWANLNTSQRARLNTNPLTLRLDLTPQVIVSDGYGEQRVNYLRGVRTNETTANPRFRARSSLLGAVIRGQPTYVSSPNTGHLDQFPPGSPEALAAAETPARSYAKYQNVQRQRTPVVYVASNNGMLHGFDAATGRERFAYVPNLLIDNYRLTRSTLFEGGLTPGIDDKPLQYDAFLNDRWRTVLVGAMRLGGRGVYALDVTDPEAVVPMWEFSNAPPAGVGGSDCAAGSRFCSSLGYTYESANMTRIRHDNKWVALVSSGYFPKDALDPASKSAAASRTSLMVIDLSTGLLIREIRTSIAPQFVPGTTRTFGLSQPITYDLDRDQLADIAVAGDLAGNLWRFDLSSDDPAGWKVDLMFITYGDREDGVDIAVGDQPISFSPQGLRDPRRPMFVFGTGKFIGAPDRVSSIPQQAFYGIRDYGTCGTIASETKACDLYPIQPVDLTKRNLDQDSEGVRRMPDAGPNQDAVKVGGWYIPLDIDAEPGERASDKVFPFFTPNFALLRSIIPKGVDPCDPGARYGLFVVDAATGLPPRRLIESGIVGGVVSSERPPADPISAIGGGDGAITIPGLEELSDEIEDALTEALGAVDEVWHRGSWRELQND